MNNGPYNVPGIALAVGPFGTYDFQRNAGQGLQARNVFYSQYQFASNYAVGAYMYGAGYSLQATVAIAGTFAEWYSSNAGDVVAFSGWMDGWTDSAAQFPGMQWTQPQVSPSMGGSPN
jgi:hypothetical protein